MISMRARPPFGGLHYLPNGRWELRVGSAPIGLFFDFCFLVTFSFMLSRSYAIWDWSLEPAWCCNSPK
jgi:hypothetical protein